MRLLALILLSITISIALQAQTSPCRVVLKGGKTADQLKLFYTGGVLADSIAIADVSRISRAARDSSVSTLSDGFYTTFMRLIAVDSTYIHTPAAFMYLQGALVCSIPAQWHKVDTIKGVLSEYNLSNLPKQSRKPLLGEFKWVKGTQPVVVVDLPEMAKVGDEIRVKFETNYPIDELTDRLQSSTLVYDRIVATTSNVSISNGNATHSYSVTIVYKVANPGTVAFEALKFKIAGKKARMSEIGIDIPRS